MRGLHPTSQPQSRLFGVNSHPFQSGARGPMRPHAMNALGSAPCGARFLENGSPHHEH